VKGYAPIEEAPASELPTGATFLRLPRVSSLEDVDAAIVGLPLDAGGAHAGARFGPRGIRESSLALRPWYNPAQRVEVFERISAIDYGDSPVRPGFVDSSLEMMRATLQYVHESGTVPIGLGGEHSVTLAQLRAAAERYGPLALVQFDAHSQLEEPREGEAAHGTLVAMAVQEGLIDPRRSTLLGMRGGLRDRREYSRARQAGFTVVPWDELAELGTGMVASAVELARGKAFLSFDIDFVDPAFAPGTAAPSVGGPTSAQALALLRGCRGLDLAGADVVEVAPERDPSGISAALGAALAYEILTLVACERPSS
jgi:agmatinase